jgi:metallo-beta-lactamase class B
MVTGRVGSGRKRATVILPVAGWLSCVALALAQPVGEEIHGQRRVEPFRIIANIYYVGFSNVGAILITSPQGHILIDSGFEETVPWLRANIEQLGFKSTDIKCLLSSHAHTDHVGGHARMKELTGASLLISDGDGPVLADGGRSDYRSDGRQLWRPVRADGKVVSGTEVQVGTVTLKAHLTPGHTKGNTTWTTVVEEGGRRYDVCFAASMRLNRVPLVGNTKYPEVADAYVQSFETLKKLSCDVFIASHSHYYDLENKRKRLKDGATPNPFIDPAGFRAYIADFEKAFREQLAKEQSGR